MGDTGNRKVVGTDSEAGARRGPFGLITRRSRVQITPPLLNSDNTDNSLSYIGLRPRKRRISDALERTDQPERLSLSHEAGSGYSPSLWVALACALGLALTYLGAVIGALHR